MESDSPRQQLIEMALRMPSTMRWKSTAFGAARSALHALGAIGGLFVPEGRRLDLLSFTDRLRQGALLASSY